VPGPWRLVLIALAVEAVLLVVALALVFGTGWRARRAARRWAAESEQGRRVLREVVRTGSAGRAGQALLAGLPTRVQVRLFTELAPSLAGRSRAHLRTLAGEIGLLARAEAMAGSRRWRDRLMGVRLLGALGAGEARVPPLLDDPHRAVRAEAVEWAGSHPTPALVERLVALLPRADRYNGFVVRDALLRVGPGAAAPVAAFLERHAGRHVLGALEVAAGLGDARFERAALRLSRDALPEVRARAAALAGAVGGAAAVEELRHRLRDPDAAVRAVAAEALGRLGDWPSAQGLAPLLRDPSWEVRSAAALALRELGSPGLLYLRRMLDDRDLFAADMARQVLDLPEGAVTERRA
jgi:HEAT repeat protein